MAAAGVAAIAVYGVAFSGAAGVARGDQRYLKAAAYVAESPPRSVIVSLVHSGSIRYYTGRDVLRWEILDPASIDVATAYLRERGYALFVVADEGEVKDFAQRFANSATARELERTAPVDVGGALVFRLDRE